MKIDKNKKYTFYEIVKNGLLLSEYGKPIKRHISIKNKLKKYNLEKYDCRNTGENKRVSYKIPGFVLIELNKASAKKAKALKNNSINKKI